MPQVDMNVHAPGRKLTHLAAVESRRRRRPVLSPGVSVAAPLRRDTPHPLNAAAVAQNCNGQPADVILQGFHWTSRLSNNPNWYQILAANAQVIRDAKFDWVWFPPPSASAYNAEGYMPTLWNILDNGYGGKADLMAAIKAIHPVGAIADIVVNHRCGEHTDGADFSSPPFAMADQRFAVCSDDEKGIGKGNPDTGEHQPAGLDLDHINTQVQQAIQDYLKSLQAAGFSGWRFDEVRGYAGAFVGQYNDASAPKISIGEFWDSDRQKVIDWVDSTRGRSMAFDFPTRTVLQSALNNREFWRLKTIDGKPTGAIGYWPAMCVTFVEDHDTFKDHPDPQEFGPGDQVLQAYAYLFTHPGMPCVFWSHYFDYGPTIQSQIKQMIELRKRHGITTTSIVNIVAADGGKYAAIIDGKVAVKLGPAPWAPGVGFSVAMSGNDFAIWTQ